jgi:hypothetical protein
MKWEILIWLSKPPLVSHPWGKELFRKRSPFLQTVKIHLTHSLEMKKKKFEYGSFLSLEIHRAL